MTYIANVWRRAFSKYWPTMKWFALMNVVVWLLVGFAVHLNWFGLHDIAFKMLDANFVKDASTQKMNQSTGFGAFIELTWHNYSGTVLDALLGLFPILPIFLFSAIMNPLSIGFTNGLAPHPFLTFLAGVVPHSIVELPMQWLAFAMAAIFFKTTWQNIRAKKMPWHGIDWREAVENLVIVILPMAIVAGAIENYITPLFLNLLK